MLLEIRDNKLENVKFTRNEELSETKIEELIISYRTDTSEENILSENIFGEPLFILKKQAYTKNKKIADIIAIDRRGNGVIIELKKHEAKLGIETQVLQYLAAFSGYSGEDFLKEFANKKKNDDSDFEQIKLNIKDFIEDDVDINTVNQKSRIILLAQSFDSAIFSIGEWLELQNISFRCIEYTYHKIEDKTFLSFSIKFDRSKEALYRMNNKRKIYPTKRTKPEIFWHNISTTQEQWNFLQEKGIIFCGFNGELGDRGTIILQKYIKGDIVIAYSSGKVGIIGYGVVEGNYRLVSKEESKPIDGCRHWLDVNWKYTLPINESIKREEFEKTEKYPNIYHPVQTSSLLGDQEKQAKLLLEDIAIKARDHGKVW